VGSFPKTYNDPKQNELDSRDRATLIKPAL